jgi:hypothetical protein
MPATWQAVLLDEWARQLAAGLLTPAGVEDVRRRLLFDAGFDRGPARDQLLIMVGDVLADARGLDPADLPGSPLAIPDDPGGLPLFGDGGTPPA